MDKHRERWNDSLSLSYLILSLLSTSSSNEWERMAALCPLTALSYAHLLRYHTPTYFAVVWKFILSPYRNLFDTPLTTHFPCRCLPFLLSFGFNTKNHPSWFGFLTKSLQASSIGKAQKYSFS